MSPAPEPSPGSTWPAAEEHSQSFSPEPPVPLSPISWRLCCWMKTPDPLPAGTLGMGLRAIWVTHGRRRTLERPTGPALLLSASLWSHVTDVSNQTRRGCGRKLPQSPHHSTPLSAVTLCGSHCDWPCAAALLPILSGLKCKCSSPALLGSVTLAV